MRCLIIDDQKAFHTILTQLITFVPTLTLVGSYQDALTAYKAIKENDIDLLLLDIEMPGMNGVELAKMLDGKGPLVIFTTSRTDYAIEAFNLNVVDYLVKPIEPARFLKAIEKAKNIIGKKELVTTPESAKDGFVFIRDSYTIKRIKIDDILYLEANANYVDIHTSAKQVYSIHSSIGSLEQKLPNRVFFKVHRSFIINLSKIDVMEGKNLVIGGKIIPVADAYKVALSERMLIL